MRITAATRITALSTKVLLTCALALVASVGFGGQASAISGLKCASTNDVSPGLRVDVCIKIGNHNADGITDVWPVITFLSKPGQNNGSPVEGGIYMYQCTSSGNGCVLIAANQKGAEGFIPFNDTLTGGKDYSLETSLKTWSLGHTYYACGHLHTSSDFKVPTSAPNMCTDLLAGS